MRDAEMLVWAGDFNYRIEATYEDALERIRNNELDYLIERVRPQTLPAAMRQHCCTLLTLYREACTGQQAYKCQTL